MNKHRDIIEELDRIRSNVDGVMDDAPVVDIDVIKESLVDVQATVGELTSEGLVDWLSQIAHVTGDSEVTDGLCRIHDLRFLVFNLTAQMKESLGNQLMVPLLGILMHTLFIQGSIKQLVNMGHLPRLTETLETISNHLRRNGVTDPRVPILLFKILSRLAESKDISITYYKDNRFMQLAASMVDPSFGPDVVSAAFKFAGKLTRSDVMEYIKENGERELVHYFLLDDLADECFIPVAYKYMELGQLETFKASAKFLGRYSMNNPRFLRALPKKMMNEEVDFSIKVFHMQLFQMLISQNNEEFLRPYLKYLSKICWIREVANEIVSDEFVTDLIGLVDTSIELARDAVRIINWLLQECKFACERAFTSIGTFDWVIRFLDTQDPKIMNEAVQLLDTIANWTMGYDRDDTPFRETLAHSEELMSVIGRILRNEYFDEDWDIEEYPMLSEGLVMIYNDALEWLGRDDEKIFEW